MTRVGALLLAAAVLAWDASAPRIAAQATVTDPSEALFDDTALHEIRLFINSRDWETLKTNYLLNAYYPADLWWRDQVVRNIGIRSRGNGSRSGFKPGLRVDFDRYTASQKFLGLKSVVLRNNTQDPSQLHERVSMLFFRQMGLPAPRESHARLYVNNAYAGLYSIVEAIDQNFLRRTYGEDRGYLFAYAYAPEDPPYYFEYRGSAPAQYVPKPFRPETHEVDPRPEVLERLVWTINASGAAFRTAIAEFLDVAGFIRFVAAEVFVADADGVLGEWGMNNYYMYRPADRNQFRFLPWDKSHAFFPGPGSSIWHNITDVPEAQQNRLMARLLESPDLRDLYLNTLLEAAQVASARPADSAPGDTRGWLEREIAREFAQVRDAVFEDSTRPHFFAEFEQEVDSMRTFARERSTFVALEVQSAR